MRVFDLVLGNRERFTQIAGDGGLRTGAQAWAAAPVEIHRGRGPRRAAEAGFARLGHRREPH